MEKGRSEEKEIGRSDPWFIYAIRLDREIQLQLGCTASRSTSPAAEGKVRSTEHILRSFPGGSTAACIPLQWHWHCLQRERLDLVLYDDPNTLCLPVLSPPCSIHILHPPDGHEPDLHSSGLPHPAEVFVYAAHSQPY